MITSPPTNTARSEFLSWYEREKSNGLVDIKFYPGNVSKSSEESVFTAINAINRAVAAGQCQDLNDDQY
jgi:hypothetical protein